MEKKFSNRPKVEDVKTTSVVTEGVDHTPFTLVSMAEGEWNICIGNSIVSARKFESTTQAREYIKRKPYELIGAMIVVFSKMAEKYGDLMGNGEINDKTAE